MKASIDQLVGQARAQVKRYREKRRIAPRRHARDGGVRSRPLEAPEDDDRRSSRRSSSAMNPMSPEEAVLQLELVGHDFFVFRNAETETSTSSTGGATGITG